MNGIKNFSWGIAFALSIIILLTSLNPTLAKKSKHNGIKMNVIDRCWRWNPNWLSNRQQLARCSVGFAGKMTNNIGKDVIMYKVTDPNDNPINPKPGTLRYGATMITRKVWITFQKNMNIKLKRPLLISSFTAIDGRGASVHIAGGACFLIFKATDIIIHGLRFNDCRPQAPSSVMGPDSKLMLLGRVDGDAIRLVTATKVWIDHNTLYDCQDGLIDVTRGSTNITISNNWFRNHDKVMLLGHDDGFLRDQNMKVTVLYNHFGPNCNQRMPRIRHGYAHVVNNLYQGWAQYAIGGSMNPSLKSESNLFIAPKSGNKEVTWKKANSVEASSWKFYSVGDVFENGALFSGQTGIGGAKPNYGKDQVFEIQNAKSVRLLTRSAGALRCPKSSNC